MGTHIISITSNACVAALAQAVLSQKRITHLQMAVGLALFAVGAGATEKTKDQLVAIYARAGVDCATYTGSEYGTVRRKVSASATLFKSLGAEKVISWIGDEKNGRAIHAIARHLAELKLDSIERVLAHCGAAPTVKPKVVHIQSGQEVTTAPQPDRQAYLFEMETAHVHIHVDNEATTSELLDAIAKLQQIIYSRKAQEEQAG